MVALPWDRSGGLAVYRTRIGNRPSLKREFRGKHGGGFKAVSPSIFLYLCMGMISPLVVRVAARFAATLITPEYIETILKGLDQGNAPDAYRQLQGLARALRNDILTPFPTQEIETFLRERGVSDDEVDLALKVRVRAPRTPKAVSFIDAVLQFQRETGASVVPDMRFDGDSNAGKAVLGWLAGFKRIKAPARKVWDGVVKKVHFGKPLGTEDASWQHGRLFLTVGRSYDPKVRTSQLTHELGHAFGEIHHINGFEPPWGQPPFISDYAEHKPNIEDIAESFRAFVEEPSFLKSKCPEKYAAIKALT